MLEVARAALQAPRVSDEPRAVDLLVDGLAVRFTDGYAASAPALKRALTALREEGEQEGVSVRWSVVLRDAWRGSCLPTTPGTTSPLGAFKSPVTTEPSLSSRSRSTISRTCAAWRATSTLRVPCSTRPMASRSRQAPSHWSSGDFHWPAFAGSKGKRLLSSRRLSQPRLRGAARDCAHFSEHARAVLYNGLGRYEAALGARPESRRTR